jgi:small subunit ribosomal protein S4
VRAGSRKRTFFKDLAAIAEERTTPDWVSRDVKDLKGTLVRLPERAEIDGNLNEQLIVEFYKR